MLRGHAKDMRASVRTSGANPFIAYAVLNDGGEPGARTGDGAYVAMDAEE